MSQINYNITNLLLREPLHLREIARKLKSNQTTIARKLKELQEQNIIDFKEQGKNKIFFIKKTLEAKEYLHIVEKNKLIQIIKKYPELKQIIEEIKRNKKISLAILFGSYAKQTKTNQSDIDIYIETTNKKIKEEIENINTKINVKIGKYNKESLLIKEIEKNNIILKGIEEYYEKNKFFN